MLRAVTRILTLRAIGLAAAIMVAGAATAAAEPSGEAIHLGVASCAGSNCHGALHRRDVTAVGQNEYTIWSTRDKHHRAYEVLLEPRAIRMAHALGLRDAAHAKICLDCHADNVPADQRGPRFQLSDGVGCEACHGGASPWLGVHISGLGHQANLNAGLYPTEKPLARAKLCLSCHYGDATKFVDHRLIGAGHPRLPFELDTFTAMQPAHFVVDKEYIKRKGLITDMQVWGAGEALALVKRMDTLLDPKRSHRGIFPEFVLFDCQSCHHDYDSLHAPRPTTTGLGPGTVKLNDANAVMIEVAAARIDPTQAQALKTHMMALHRATTADWAVVEREARGVRQAASALAPVLANHHYTADDLRAMAHAVIALGLSGGDVQYEHAEQSTMTLEALIANMKSAGYLGGPQEVRVQATLDALYHSFTSGQTFRPQVFLKALREMQRLLGA